MFNRHKNKFIAMTMLFCAAPVLALELQPSLREADRLYQSGRYAEASAKALQIYRFFPDDLQTLLILGMSDFNAGSYQKAADWFKLAHKKSPGHPLCNDMPAYYEKWNIGMDRLMLILSVSPALINMPPPNFSNAVFLARALP